MFCSKCGAQLNGAAFCSACGTAANSAPAQQFTPPTQPTYGTIPYQTPYGQPAPQTTNGLAVASLVVSLVCLAPVGLILGLVALNQINESNGTQGGKGMAIAGVTIGAVFTAIGFLLLTIA
jgi:hypothetical protein